MRTPNPEPMSDSVLNDRDSVLRHDPQGIYDRALGFADQCDRARSLVGELEWHRPIGTFRNVVLAGMGGSAAAGDLLKALMDAEGFAPVVVSRDYRVPTWVGSDTLVLVSSYSGDTEETLSAYEDARSRGAAILVLTSGGELGRRAEANGYPVVLIPGGSPPRMALGSMFIPLVVAACSLGLLADQDLDEAVAVLRSGRADWAVETPDNLAKQLAHHLHGTVGAIYGLGAWQGAAANRWRGQINENAKQMALSGVLPEMDHNEILGWQGAREQTGREWATIFLGSKVLTERMRLRAEATAELIAPACRLKTVHAEGERLLSQMLWTVSLGDFVSVYLAALVGVNPFEIDAINRLKAILAAASA